LQRLSFGFVLGYHGCDKAIAEKLLGGTPFQASENDYDWLGPGIYFWEANPLRGLEYASEAIKRKGSRIREPLSSVPWSTSADASTSPQHSAFPLSNVATPL
jgi:hypothetical protein